MTTVQIDLPNALAQQAQQAGLLSTTRMEAMLRAPLRREALSEVRAQQASAPEDLTPEIEQEIVDAVRQVRAERRTG